MAEAAPEAAASAESGEKGGGVIPEFEELKLCVRHIKEANPDIGIAKVHAAVKTEHPDWQVSQDRVKKILAETVILVDGKPKKGLVNKSDPTLSAKEISKQKTEAALAKKKEAAKQKNNITASGGSKMDSATWRPGGDISH